MGLLRNQQLKIVHTQHSHEEERGRRRRCHRERQHAGKWGGCGGWWVTAGDAARFWTHFSNNDNTRAERLQDWNFIKSGLHQRPAQASEKCSSLGAMGRKTRKWTCYWWRRQWVYCNCYCCCLEHHPVQRHNHPNLQPRVLWASFYTSVTPARQKTLDEDGF